MPFTVNGNVVEHWEKSMPAQYWARHKKANINLTTEGPFNLERQFADQWELIEMNRNPQYFKPMKPDKPLSEVKFMKKGQPSNLTIKAKVLNKVVREASGNHQYAMVAPIRTKEDRENDKKKPFDADMDPLTAPYRREANQKPAMVNFGHRPRSANRVFHPATMKMKLKHGEIARKDEKDRSTFGLPVAILKTVINAPKLYRPSESQEKLDDEYKASLAAKGGSNAEATGNDPLGLFTVPPDSTVQGSVGEEESWVSGQGGSVGGRTAPSTSSSMGPSSKRGGRRRRKEKEPRWKSGKPLIREDWDEGFHTIRRHPNEIFKIKASGLLEGEKLPLKERLTRFNKKSASTGPADDDNDLGKEKRDMDALLAKGQKPPPPPGRIPKEENPFYDPELDEVVLEMRRYARKERDRLEKVNDDHAYKLLVATIPDVEYYPDTLKEQLMAGDRKVIRQVAKKSEAVKMVNPYEPSFKVSSIAENTDKFFARKRLEAGDSLSHPKDMNKSEFDPGVEFTERGFGDGSSVSKQKSMGSMSSLTLEKRVKKMTKESPFNTGEYVPPKKKNVPKRKVNLVEQKMKDALRRAAKDDDDALFAEFMGKEALSSILQEDVDEKAAEQRKADIEAALVGPAPGASLALLASSPIKGELPMIDPTGASDTNTPAANVPADGANEEDVTAALFSDTKDLLKGAPPVTTAKEALSTSEA